MSEFVDNLHEVFERFGRIEARRMFGGHGIYHQGLMFGLVAQDTLYLKADAGNLAHFERLQLPPFEYLRQGKTARLSYHQAPVEIFEDRDEAAAWARRAWEAAVRSRQSSAPKTRKAPAAKSSRATAANSRPTKQGPRKPASK